MSEQSVVTNDQGKKLRPIETLVFLDLVPDHDNPIKTTKVNLLAMPRENFPKDSFVLAKLKPQDQVVLSLRDETDFDEKVLHVINAFIRRQNPPVCLFSHYGNRYDFPLLKLKLNNENISLPDDVMCADSAYAFYDVRELEPDHYGNAVRAEFYEGNSRPEESYKLWDLYEKYVMRDRADRADRNNRDNDNTAAFFISMHLAKKILNWVDKKQRPFSDVEPTDLLYPKL
ncbi:hypothetical protein PYW07_014162 [Mythimna separata]|uniref:Uncharacterized protein n=1 Tax=Mythimna separata TaxID=271217 RepID=A0AAD7YYZ3_MYTSE|nr:hypothetical protein PYW07_014162 [Mythimna separata]